MLMLNYACTSSGPSWQSRDRIQFRMVRANAEWMDATRLSSDKMSAPLARLPTANIYHLRNALDIFILNV